MCSTECRQSGPRASKGEVCWHNRGQNAAILAKEMLVDDLIWEDGWIFLLVVGIRLKLLALRGSGFRHDWGSSVNPVRCHNWVSVKNQTLYGISLRCVLLEQSYQIVRVIFVKWVDQDLNRISTITFVSLQWLIDWLVMTYPIRFWIFFVALFDIICPVSGPAELSCWCFISFELQ